MYRRLLAISLVASLSFYGCGTILKEDRINKPHSSQLDWRIVLLDGIGLFFYVLPGVIAYAVDYSNGTLFLPAGRSLKLSGLSEDEIREALERETRQRIAAGQVVALSLAEARESPEFRGFFLAERQPAPATR